jgi:hypothetical protein
LRPFLFLLFVLLIGFLVYTQFIQPKSEDLEAVKALKKEFDLAMNQYMRALKYTSGFGMDMVGDLEMAVARIKKVQNDLRNIKNTLQDEAAREKADILETKIDTFLKKNDLE